MGPHSARKLINPVQRIHPLEYLPCFQKRRRQQCNLLTSQDYAHLGDFEHESIVKNRLRKEILVPLRKALQLPEVYMSAKQWQSRPYNRVPSVAMKNYTNIFLHRDNKRFRDYLENMKAGKAKIAARALLSHEIIQQNSLCSSREQNVSELQWKRIVDDMLEKGKLTNCIAVCDVSGSMKGIPMDVSVALGLLVSELSEDPWKGHVITFSSFPQLHLIEGESLMSKTKFIRNMDWGSNTNFQSMFDEILRMTVRENVSDDKMIKKVFVFSDMEFDEASQNPWEMDYMAIKRKFAEEGYKNIPEIVFWNLRNSASTLVTAAEKGVCLVSGFSKNMLSVFMETGEIKNPIETMEAAISGEIYQQLVVYD